VSHPVAPNPPEGGYPPPGQPGAAPYSPAPYGQPGPQQAQYPPQPGQYPPAPGAVNIPDFAKASKKSGAGRIFLRIGVAIVVVIVGFLVKSLFWNATDKAKDAAAGDCIASSKDVKTDKETDATAKVVDCASADAAFTVVAKIPGETDTKSKSCDKYFKEDEEFFVYSADNGATGYLLCLRPIKK
jgi:hypothetical protein